MTRSITMTALTLALSAGLAAYGARANETPTAPRDMPAPGTTQGNMMEGMSGMMGMMNMMAQMNEMAETCNAMMQRAMPDGEKGGAPATTAPNKS